jgi:hypothetical protein
MREMWRAKMDHKSEATNGKEAKVELKSVDLKQAGISAPAKHFNKI